MIKHQMNSQLRVLKELQNLIDKADAAETTGDVPSEDIDHLRGYVEDMRRACKVAIALETALTPPKAEKKSESTAEEKPAKRKSRTKKVEALAETPPTPETAETEADDLGFLD